MGSQTNTNSQASKQPNTSQAQATSSNSGSEPNQSTNSATDNQTPSQINQTNNSPVTINLQVQGFLGDNKTVNQLKDLFSDLMSQQNQANQDRLRQLNGANLARRG